MRTQPRPRQVTVAGWLVILGGVAVLASVWEQIAGLRSLDSQATWQRLLDRPPLSHSGVSLDHLLDVVQALGLVAGGCAAAVALLGWQLLRRSRPALIAVTVLTVPLFLAGLVTGGVFPIMVVIAVVMLWLQPARDWYSGARPVEPGEGPGPAENAGLPRTPPASNDFHQSYTRRSVTGKSVAGAILSRQAPSPDPGPPGDRSGPRPGALIAAAVLTWVGAVLGVVLAVGVAAAVIADPDPLWRRMLEQRPNLTDQGVTESSVVAVAVVLAVLAIGWMVAGAVMAVLVWLRIGWARTVLVIGSVVSALVLLVASLASPVAVVPMIGSVLVAALLMRPEVTRWLTHDTRVTP